MSDNVGERIFLVNRIFCRCKAIEFRRVADDLEVTRENWALGELPGALRVKANSELAEACGYCRVRPNELAGRWGEARSVVLVALNKVSGG